MTRALLVLAAALLSTATASGPAWAGDTFMVIGHADGACSPPGRWIENGEDSMFCGFDGRWIVKRFATPQEMFDMERALKDPDGKP